MVTPVDRRVWLVLISVFAACADPPRVEPCAAEFFAGSVTFPNGTVYDSCTPAAPAGLVVTVELPCVVGFAEGVSEGGDVAWRLEARDAWYATTGAVDLDVRYEGVDAPPSRCAPGPDGVSVSCTAFGSCQFNVTRAAHRDGDTLEAELLAPCTLGSSGAWRPVLTSMRYRAHLSGVDTYDAGYDGCALP